MEEINNIKRTIAYIEHELKVLEEENQSYMDQYLYSISLSQKGGLKRGLEIINSFTDQNDIRERLEEEIVMLEGKIKNTASPEDSLILYGRLESLNLILEMLIEKPLNPEQLKR